MTRIKSIITQYLKESPDEHDRLTQLRDLLEHCPNDEDLLSRKNYVGHITVSGFVVSRCRTKVLRLNHKKLGIYLQPGGHFQSGDPSLLDAARRKIAEEAGLSSLDYLASHFEDEIPIDIDTHYINATDSEPRHFHHDFRYLFLCEDKECKVVINEEKFQDYKWGDINELLRMQTFSTLKQKIEKTLSGEFRPKVFFDRLSKQLQIPAGANTIVVTHLLQDAQVYLRTLDKVSHILSVIPKPKSIDTTVLSTARTHFTINQSDRETLQTSNIVHDLLRSAAGRVVLFDIGGYFAPLVNDLVDSFPGKLVGVIEDTENGHQKYDRAQPLKVPVFSVARSPLKDNEDFLVGQSVLFSADAILREVGKLIQYLDCSVFGYGKIGGSIADHLSRRGAKVSVYDKDPIRRMAASNRLCKIPDREQIIKQSDVIFCATGGQVLKIHDFRALKPGCVVFSVTSSDDEMDITYLNAEYLAEDVTQHVTKFSSFSNHFYLVNKGNAVNFIHKAALGDFIHIVRGEMIYALKVLLEQPPEPGIHELTRNQRSELAELWLKTFASEPAHYSDLAVGGI